MKAEIVSATANVIMAVAALFTMLVAIRGLGLWKRQLVSEDEYKLAKEMLTLAYRLRLASQKLRGANLQNRDELREKAMADLTKLWPEFEICCSVARALWRSDKRTIQRFHEDFAYYFATPVTIGVPLPQDEPETDGMAKERILDLERFLEKHLKKPIDDFSEF